MTGNAAFTIQCKVVAERFDAMIKSMDDAAKFQGHIEYMGHSHKPRNVDRAMFDAFAGFLISAPTLIAHYISEIS